MLFETLPGGTALERQVLLLVGSVGSGKSTFVNHLVNVALSADLLKRTVWLRVNLNLAPREQMQSWLISQVERELKASEPETDFDELETLMVLYSAELNQLRKGPLRLLDPESQSDKERLTDRLMQLQADQTLTVNALTRHLCAERGRLLIVVLDNADKRTLDEQLSVFQLAQWLQSELRCLTVLPLRDTASLPVFDVHMPKDASGKGRGFGFVSVSDADAAMRALRVLQGARVGRRPLQVRVAEERPPLRRQK